MIPIHLWPRLLLTITVVVVGSVAVLKTIQAVGEGTWWAALTLYLGALTVGLLIVHLTKPIINPPEKD